MLSPNGLAKKKIKIEFSKLFLNRNSVFEDFEKSRNFLFVFVLQCTQR